jgi:hypothetical protein
VVYLALGRPVVLQDTGWPEVVAPRPGLLPFADVSGAAKSIAEAEGNWERHSASARKLADEVFAPAFALKPLLERVG